MKLSPRPARWYEDDPVAAGPRTRLRRPTIRDVPAVLRVFGDAPEVTRHVAWRPMRTREEAREFLSHAIRGWAEERPTWFLEDAETGEVVGSIIAACDAHEVEISYVVAPAWWRRGHATEAVEAVCRAAFTDAGVQRVRAYCDADNAVSIRVLEKAGFEREETLPAHALHHGSAEPRDCFAYVRSRT